MSEAKFSTSYSSIRNNIYTSRVVEIGEIKDMDNFETFTSLPKISEHATLTISIDSSCVFSVSTQHCNVKKYECTRSGDI